MKVAQRPHARRRDEDVGEEDTDADHGRQEHEQGAPIRHTGAPAAVITISSLSPFMRSSV